MTEKLQQKMKEEIAKLPTKNQEAINSVDWGTVSEEIGKRYLLTESEINDFQIETGIILLGLSDFEMYVLRIEDIGVNKTEAEKIAKEAFEKIFMPVANKIEEKVKSELKSKTPKWDQSVNFIISGGDYSNFVDN